MAAFDFYTSTITNGYITVVYVFIVYTVLDKPNKELRGVPIRIFFSSFRLWSMGSASSIRPT